MDDVARDNPPATPAVARSAGQPSPTGGQHEPRTASARRFRDSDVDTDLTLAQVFRILRRRKMTLILPVLVIPVVAFLLARQLTPEYTAYATVIVEPEQLNLGDIERVVGGTNADLAGMASEIEVLRSRSLAERVVAATDLIETPEFNPYLREPGTIDVLIDEVRALVGMARPPPPERTEEEQAAREMEAAVNNVLRALDVDLRGDSRAIEIAFVSIDADRARDVTNAVADAYIVDRLESNYEATRRATAWLNDRTTTLRRNVEEAERRVEEYRAQSGITLGVESTVLTEQISQLNRQIVDARAALAQAESSLTQIRAGGALTAVPQVLASDVIQQLRAQEAELRSQEAELAVRLADRHPQLVQVRSQLANTGGLIGAEVQRIVTGLQAEATAARDRVDRLEDDLARLEATVSTNSEAEIQLRALEREAEASRSLLESILGREQEATQQFDLEEPGARVLSAAVTPSGPSYPNKRILVMVAFVLAVFFGLLLVFVRELLDDTFRSGDEVEGILGLPCVALVPRIRKTRAMGSVFDFIIAKPLSPFAEAVRSIRTALWLDGRRPKTVVISSSRPGEGKTMTAISLARAAALAGERVVLVDCDVRRPSIRGALGASEQRGLSDFLSDGANLSDITLKDKASDLRFIPAGSSKANSAKLLMSDAMAGLLGQLARQYDLVVLDSPPILAITDSRVLARLADAVIYCVQWRGIARSVVATGVRGLQDAGASIVGVALTQVNIRRHARSGYADSEAYHPRYSGYYTQ